MFRFESPQYLYLLLVLLALAAIHYYIIFKKKQQVKRFGDPVLLETGGEVLACHGCIGFFYCCFGSSAVWHSP